jgi:hypothetical protein
VSETKEHNTPQLTVVEVICDENIQEGRRPAPQDKLPLTRPVLSRTQKESILRSLTDPAKAASAQFPKVSGDKNSEGRKRSSPNTERNRSMQTQEATNQNSNQMPEVPRQERDAAAKAESVFNTKDVLKFGGFFVATTAVSCLIAGGVSLGVRALAKKWGLLTPQDG